MKINPRDQTVEAETEKKTVVLIGYIGSGKTTLFNKCCNKQQKVEAGGPSVTRETFLTESAYGNGFLIFDTPGIGSQKQKIIHAAGILNALAEGPLNQILIVIKFERIDLMAIFLKNMIQNQFKRFKQMITIVVTNWDEAQKNGQLQTENQRKNEIQDLATSYGISSIIYSSLSSKGPELCEKIDKILVETKNLKVELIETEIYSYFDLIEVRQDIEELLSDKKELVRVKFKKKTQVIKKFITGFNESNSIMVELMHALTVQIKNFANQTILEFEKENMTEFSKLYELYNEANVAYLIDSQLKLELMDDVNQVIRLAQNKMKQSSNHCYNYLKRCPYCKEVWIKVAGCDGETTCGNFPEKDEEKIAGISLPLEFKFTFGEKDLMFEQVKKNYEEVNIKQKYKIQQNQKIGCGRKIVWKDIPPLNNQQFDELLDPGILDYLANDVQIEMNLKEKLQKEIELRKQENKVKKI